MQGCCKVERPARTARHTLGNIQRRRHLLVRTHTVLVYRPVLALRLGSFYCRETLLKFYGRVGAPCSPLTRSCWRDTLCEMKIGSLLKTRHDRLDEHLYGC